MEKKCSLWLRLSAQLISCRLKTLYARRIVVLLFLFPLASTVVAQFQFSASYDGRVMVTGYTGPGGAVTIPSQINGRYVNTIGNRAFFKSGVTSVTIPWSVSVIGGEAFFGSQL